MFLYIGIYNVSGLKLEEGAQNDERKRFAAWSPLRGAREALGARTDKTAGTVASFN